MVGNASGGDPGSYEEMERSCVRTVIVGAVVVVIGLALLGLGLAKLIELIELIK